MNASNSARIENDFNYHRADANKGAAHEQVRHACKALAHRIDALCPNGREKALALTKIEEAMFWANAAIARNVPAIPEDETEIQEALKK